MAGNALWNVKKPWLVKRHGSRTYAHGDGLSANLSEDTLALGGREGLGVAHTLDHSAVGWDEAGGRDYRAGEGTSSHFVDANHPQLATLPECSLCLEAGEHHHARPSYLARSAASMTPLAAVADRLPEPADSLTMATATCGLSAGAKPMNQA